MRPVFARVCLPALALACACAMAPQVTADAASSSLVVSLSVPSAVSIGAGSCQSGSPDRTSMGTVLPGTSFVTGTSCHVAFGSSNDTSQLRVWQTDHDGSAMWLPPWGSRDLAIGGGDGFVSESFAAANDDSFLDSEIQPDGALVVTGRRGTGVNRTLVARYLPNGTRDTAGFASPNGYVYLGANTTPDAGQSIAVLADGSMIVGAQSQNGGGNWDFTLFKLDSSGNPVNAFGGTGSVVRSINAANDRIYAICVDESRNRGYAVGDSGLDVGVLAFDLTTGGDVAAFGPVRTINVSGTDQGRGCAIDASGNLLVAGLTNNTGDGSALIAKFAPTGVLDVNFDGPSGGNGTVVLNLDTTANATEEVWDVEVAPDGDLVAVGGINEGALGTNHELVVRLDPTTGMPDAAFGGGDGWRVVDITSGGPPAYGTEVVIQPDGRFYTVGGAPGAFDAWVRRYLPDGSDDATFGGGDGQFSWDWPLSTATTADTRGASIGIDGQLWVIGEDTDGDDEAIVTRLESLPMPDYGAGANWGAGSSFFGMCLWSVTGTGSNVPAPWTASGACPQAVGAQWGGIPTTSGSAGATIARLTTPGANDGIASVRFGLKVPTTQRPGTYLAPITFEAIAPA